MSKLIVELPDHIHGELKKRAAGGRTTLKEIITSLIRDYLEAPEVKTGKPDETGLCGLWEDARTAEEIMNDMREHRRWFSGRAGSHG